MWGVLQKKGLVCWFRGLQEASFRFACLLTASTETWAAQERGEGRTAPAYSSSSRELPARPLPPHDGTRAGILEHVPAFHAAPRRMPTSDQWKVWTAPPRDMLCWASTEKRNGSGVNQPTATIAIEAWRPTSPILRNISFSLAPRTRNPPAATSYGVHASQIHYLIGRGFSTHKSNNFNHQMGPAATKVRATSTLTSVKRH
jgi:hypothetical protein